MLETDTRTINDHEFMVTQYPAMEGLRIKTRLIQLLGPTIAKALEAGGRGDEDALGSALTALFDRLDEKETPALILRMLSGSRRDGVEITESVFNMEFAGDYATLYQLLYFIVEHNRFFDFSSIGGKLAGLMQTYRGMQDGSMSQSPTSTPAGDS